MPGVIDYLRKPIQPQYFLAKPNREIISKLSEICHDSMSIRLNDVSELSFSIPYQLDIAHVLQRNKNVDLIKERYLIKMVQGTKIEWFTVNSLGDDLGDADMLNVRCYSLARELSDKRIHSYFAESYHAEQVLTELLANTLWNIDYLDADFKLSYRTFDFSSNSALEAVFSVAETYNAIVHFNTEKRLISMTKPELTGINRGLTVGYGKLSKSMNRETSAEEMVTRLYASGRDGLGIQKVNPTGQNYIENFGYWLYPFERDSSRKVITSSLWMSDGLCHALLDYNNLVESNKEKFNQYLDQLQQYEKDLIPLQIDLNKLQNDEAVLEEVTLSQQFADKMFFEKYTHSGNSSRTFQLNSDYAYAVMIRLEPAAGVSISVNGTWVNTVSGKWTMLTRSKGTDSVTVSLNGGAASCFIQVNTISLGEYDTSSNEAIIVDRYSLDQKKNQISLKEVEISNLNSKIIAVKQQITQLQTLLTAENNFSSEQLQELNYFVIEREFNEDKYIDEKDLYEAALEKFRELQVPQLSVDIDIVNFLEIVEEQLNWDKLNLGDYVNVRYESVGIGVTARISEIQYNYDSSSISLTLSNIKNVNDESTRIEKFLNETKNTSIIVDTNKTKWGQAVVDSSDMSKLFDRFWNKVTNEINMSINNTVDINNKGITITDPDDPLRFLRLTNGALGLTRSGGLRYETAITADGLIAEMVLGKIILGQRVVIGDTTGVFTIEGSRLMIDDRCGREVVKLGLLSEQPDRFGFFLNRYGSSNCNDTTKVNRVSMTADEGFIIERFRNGIADKTFGTSLDGDLFVKAGVDDQVFTIDKNGLALGSSVWARAPFHADYYGNVWMNKLYADSAEIQNSLFKDGQIEGSSLTLRDGAGVMKMFPLKGFWAGAEEFEDAVASIAMDGTAKFKKLKITDNQNTLLIDSEQRKIFMNQWDIVGAGAIDAELIAATMVTAEDGFISSIVSGKVSTLTRAAVQGWSNYIKIEGKELTFLTSMVEAGTSTHKALSDGRKLYWRNASQSGEMTTDVTSWPVMVYGMTDKTKMKLYFEGDGQTAYPIISMGEGDARQYGKGLITKPNGSLELLYSAQSNGRGRSLKFMDDKVIMESESGPVEVSGKEIIFKTEAGSTIHMKNDGDIEIKANRNIKINGQRIDLN